MPGRHYQIVTGGNALGLELYHLTSAWRAVRQRTGFISVYRLGEDGDLLKEGGGMLSICALRARSYKTKAEA